MPDISGKSLGALVVDYKPGGASPSHIHAKSAFIFGYVLSGEIESQVNDRPQRLYRAGESFYETPAPGIRQPQCEQEQTRQSYSRCSSSIPTTRN
jgi:glyoxylate utilization-related uncharacterized protein